MGALINMMKYKTKFTELDNYVRIGDGNLILVCGQSKVGKSAFLHNLILNFISENHKVLFISLQKTKEEIFAYSLSNLSHINVSMIHDILGDVQDNINLTADEMDRFYLSMSELDNINTSLTICRQYAINEIEFVIAKAKESNSVDLVIIDSLTLIYNSEFCSLYEQNKNITQRLKKLAGEHNIPIIISGNINTSDIKSREDKRPKYSDIPFSIEYDFDIILGLYNDELINPDDSKYKGISEIEIMKNNGAAGGIRLAFMKDYNKYANLSYDWYDDY
ncbi:MAG: hypothetical protein K2Q03_01525 [Sphingobacteriaceae bacterium]|nr:hypothetical protein [Sphingobacteriaceae bacterium]